MEALGSSTPSPPPSPRQPSSRRPSPRRPTFPEAFCNSFHRRYEVRKFSLELWLELGRGLDTLTLLTGQLGAPHRPDRPLSSVPVFLMSNERLLDHTFSDTQGKFFLECRPQSDPARLLVVLDNRRVEIPLTT